MNIFFFTEQEKRIEIKALEREIEDNKQKAKMYIRFCKENRKKGTMQQYRKSHFVCLKNAHSHIAEAKALSDLLKKFIVAPIG